MNGNFEIDKGAYPYASQRFGEANKLVHVPSQKIIFDLGLPNDVVARAALTLNTYYHGGNTVHLTDALLSPADVLISAADEKLTGAQREQAILRIRQAARI